MIKNKHTLLVGILIMMVQVVWTPVFLQNLCLLILFKNRKIIVPNLSQGI